MKDQNSYLFICIPLNLFLIENEMLNSRAIF